MQPTEKKSQYSQNSKKILDPDLSLILHNKQKLIKIISMSNFFKNLDCSLAA